eukprot:scaffold25360_cov122-Isochrysis_galbana.AAC.1
MSPYPPRLIRPQPKRLSPHASCWGVAAVRAGFVLVLATTGRRMSLSPLSVRSTSLPSSIP